MRSAAKQNASVRQLQQAADAHLRPSKRMSSAASRHDDGNGKKPQVLDELSPDIYYQKEMDAKLLKRKGELLQGKKTATTSSAAGAGVP